MKPQEGGTLKIVQVNSLERFNESIKYLDDDTFEVLQIQWSTHRAIHVELLLFCSTRPAYLQFFFKPLLDLCCCFLPAKGGLWPLRTTLKRSTWPLELTVNKTSEPLGAIIQYPILDPKAALPTPCWCALEDNMTMYSPCFAWDPCWKTKSFECLVTRILY